MVYRRALSIVIIVVASLLATANPSPAQTSDGQAVLPATPMPLVWQIVVPPVSPTTADPLELAQRMSELQQWTREFTDWKEWEDRWRGRPEPGAFGARDRRTKPDPPVWLFDDCRDLADVEDMRADACRLLAAWQEDYATAQVRAKMLAERTQDEAATKTKWWRNVHVDALWLTPNASVIYGVVGVHMTLKVAGRWQVFAAPGALLMNIPTPRQTREWRPATDLGLSYRLMDMRFPGSRRQGTLHVNLARAWLLGGSESLINSSVDLAGLSLTFK